MKSCKKNKNWNSTQVYGNVEIWSGKNLVKDK